MSPKLFPVTLLIAVSSLMSVGCNHNPFVPASQLTAAQNHAREMYSQNQQLLASEQSLQMMLQSSDSDKQLLMQQLNQTESQLATANARIDNLLTERNELKDRMGKALAGSPMPVGIGTGVPLPGDQFRFDPATGLNKFHKDIMFDLGSDTLRPETNATLSEFVSTVQSGVATGMRILVVGHTDDHQIVRPETRREHPTNWHLSTDRSAAVILALTKLGVASERMAAMGYSEF
ncbi:MAG: OmpA family protein, partial [Planctomycetaceae bacterium]|nr:OmpA family protein [Planctomycetaceae bacterium]